MFFLNFSDPSIDNFDGHGNGMHHHHHHLHDNLEPPPHGILADHGAGHHQADNAVGQEAAENGPTL